MARSAESTDRAARVAKRAKKNTKAPSQKGQWTKSALAAKVKERAAAQETLKQAVAFAIKHGYGVRKAIRLGKYEGIIKKSTLTNAIKGNLKYITGDRKYNAILTEQEEKALVQWVVKSARNMNAAAERQSGDLTQKVIQMLRVRRTDNRRRKYCSGCTPLTRAEKRLLQPNATLSHVWEQRFLARHPELQLKGEKAEDAKRAKKQTEGTVQNHFFGQYGLEKELIDAGIMDPITKLISDPRRILGIDETPQMLDNNGQGPRPKAMGVKGERLCRSATLNRESVSVCMAQDLSGFQYGPQLNIARTLWTASLTDCMDAPDWALRFDDKIHSFAKKSTYLLMSKSAHGVQTAETLKDYMQNLDEQITARSDADMALGLSPIERPVVILTDNHASRFSDDMLKEYATEQSTMRLWFEESNVSQFLQWLDQINKQFHGCYTKARKEYKLRHRHTYEDEVDIGLSEFIEIFGGCRTLGVEGMWFTWCSPQNVIAACRKVGFLGYALDPSQIDRSEFVDRVGYGELAGEGAECAETIELEVDPAEMEEVVKTPEGMRSDSVEAMKAKLELAMEHGKKLRRAVLAPLDLNKVPGLMAPRLAPLKKRVRDGTRIEMSEGGSATMRMLHERHQERRARTEAEEAAAQAKRDMLAARRQQKTDEDAALQAQYDLCFRGCHCGKTPCPMADKVQCSICYDIKRGVCRKAVCRQAPTVANKPFVRAPPPIPSPPLAQLPPSLPFSMTAPPAYAQQSMPTAAGAMLTGPPVLAHAIPASVYVNFTGQVRNGSNVNIMSVTQPAEQ